MLNQACSRLLPLALVVALLVAGCTVPPQQTQLAPTPPAAEPTAAPTIGSTTVASPTTEVGGIEPPEVYDDLGGFKDALLQSLMDQDSEKLLAWMTEPFLTGWWRADGSDTLPADALQVLYREYLGPENRLEWVEDVDLKALMGDQNPLAFPRSEAGVIDATLVSGLGKDGRDEAVLYIAREPDDGLKWHGWLYILGGFSGARLGGLQPYANEAHGYSMYLPVEYEVVETDASNVLIMAPGAGHPGQERAAAFINVEPAGGRSVEEITEQIKADLGPGFDIPPGTAMGLDKALAIVLSGLPGQDVNRQLFVVYNDLLYHITFVPDNPELGQPYRQMEDLYAMIVNTFHFTG